MADRPRRESGLIYTARRRRATGWVTRVIAVTVNSLLSSPRGRKFTRVAVRVARAVPGGTPLIRRRRHDDLNAIRTLGGVGTNLLLDNDRVRIWELRLAPGEHTDLHEHRLDYVLVPISGDRVGADVEPDSHDALGLAESSLTTPVRPGLAVYVPRGGVERAVNVGEHEYHEVLIELKDPPDEREPDRSP